MTTPTEALQRRLRDAVTKLRRTPMPIADLVPMLQQAADALAQQAATPITMPLADAQMLLSWMDETFGNGEGVDWQDEDAAAVGDALNKAIQNFKRMRAAVTDATPARQAATPTGDTLSHRLQQRCSDWGTYWRASDAHGVNLTTEQATELLRDALGVEVEIAAARQAATPRRRPDRQPEPTDLTHYRAILDIWAEANAVDTVLGSRDRLLAKVTRLRDAMGAGVPLEERQAATPTLTDEQILRINGDEDSAILAETDADIIRFARAILAAAPLDADAWDAARMQAVERNGWGIERDEEGMWTVLKYRRYGNALRISSDLWLGAAIDAAMDAAPPATPAAQCAHGVLQPHECKACADDPSDEEVRRWMQSRAAAPATPAAQPAAASALAALNGQPEGGAA